MRRSLLAALAAAAVLGGPAASARPPEVTVRVASEVTVAAPEMTVADLGPVDGDPALAEQVARVSLGPSPAPGAIVRLDPAYLAVRLRQHQIDPARVRLLAPDRVTVARASQAFPGPALLEAATREALERLAAIDPAGGPHALTPVNRPGELRIPAGSVEVVVRVPDAAPPLVMLPVAVTVRVDGRDAQTVPLMFRVSRRETVVVAVRPLAPRAALSEADFRVEQRPALEVPPGALAAVPDPGDLEAVRVIRAGEVVTDRALRPRVVVRRGETVTLLVEGEGFRVTARGIVGEDGRRGDVVRVVNPVSRREVLGRVEGSGVVRVSP
jgi:flagella basal body P-ring formation protein FlgA